MKYQENPFQISGQKSVKATDKMASQHGVAVV